MDSALALGEIAEKVGVVAAATAAAATLVLGDVRRRALAMSIALILVAVVLVGHIWNTEQFRSISGDAATFTIVLVLGLALVVSLAAAFIRRPELFPLLAVAAVPFRVPIEAGGSTVNLLVPLYGVIAAAAAAHVWRGAHDPDHGPWFAGSFALRKRGRPPDGDESARRLPAGLERAIALFIVLYALQSLYSGDFDNALEHMAFFYVPFALLLTLLAEVRWNRSLLVGCLGVLLTLALAFSAIGFWEYERRELLWNPKVISANEFESYFRVNSVFWDPNVYGRFLALVMVLVTAVLVWSGRQLALVGAVVLAVLWGGLVLTFSQSSVASLLVGLAVIAALRWDARRAAALSALAVGLGALFLVSFQDALRLDLGSSSGLRKATSGRSDLIEGGGALFFDRPLWGYGSGSFARSFRVERKGNQQQAVSASHTLPITIAAEQGIVGLLAYLLVLVSAFRLLLGVSGAHARAPPVSTASDGAGPAPAPATQVVAGVALTAAFAALVAHTMMYAAFFEDPSAWVILGVALGLARQPAGVRARAPAAAPAADAAPAAA